MARNVTLGQLRSDIRQQADAISSTSRHPDTALNRLINQAIQRFRERLCAEGASHYLTSTTGSLAVGATSPYPFGTLDLSAVSPSVVRTAYVDVTVNGEIHALLHVPFSARNDYGGPTRKKIPQAWAHYGTRKLAILPPSDSAYVYVVWYLPVLADLANDADTYDGVAGWEDYVTWDVVTRLTVRDTDPAKYQLAVDYGSRLWADILNMASRVTNAGGAVIGRDTMGQRYSGVSRARMLPDP